MEIKASGPQINFVSRDSLKINSGSDFEKVRDLFEDYVPDGKNYVFVGSNQEKDKMIGLGYRYIGIQANDGAHNWVENIKAKKTASIDALVLSTFFLNPGENHTDLLSVVKQKLVSNGLIKIENASIFFNNGNLEARKQLFREFTESGFNVWVLPKGEPVSGSDEKFSHQAVTIFAQKL